MIGDKLIIHYNLPFNKYFAPIFFHPMRREASILVFFKELFTIVKEPILDDRLLDLGGQAMQGADVVDG